MLKYIGGALLVASGWLIGNSLNAVFNDRIALLERFKEFIIYAESEIIYYNTDIYTLIDKFKQETCKYDNLIFEEKNKSILLTKETGKLLSGFFQTISTLDSDSLKGYFRETSAKIDNLLIQAKKDASIKGKMLKKLTPVIAVGLFILTL